MLMDKHTTPNIPTYTPHRASPLTSSIMEAISRSPSNADSPNVPLKETIKLHYYVLIISRERTTSQFPV